MTNTICDFCSKNESIKKENMNGIDIYLCGDCLRWRKEIKKAICYEESDNN